MTAGLILTTAGADEIEAAYHAGETVKITVCSIGDGGGSAVTVDPSATALKGRFGQVPLSAGESFDGMIGGTAIIPCKDYPGRVVREFGLESESGTLIAYGAYPDTHLPGQNDGIIKELIVRFAMPLVNAASVTLIVDPNIAIITQEEGDRRYYRQSLKLKEVKDQGEMAQRELRSNIGLGSSSTEDKVESLTDTTPGRVTITGWQGLGGSGLETSEAELKSPYGTGSRLFSQSGGDNYDSFGSAGVGAHIKYGVNETDDQLSANIFVSTDGNMTTEWIEVSPDGTVIKRNSQKLYGPLNPPPPAAINLPNGTLDDALRYITPEMFFDVSDDMNDRIQACADYAKASGFPVLATGVYPLTRSVSFDSVRWRGGTFTTTDGAVSVKLTSSDIEGVTFDMVYVGMLGGKCRIRKNKLRNQTYTSAVFIQLTSEGHIDCTFNEFTNCNYAILHQGGNLARPLMRSGFYSFNTIRDIRGDGIELNVVNGQYLSGLRIEGNIIDGVNSDTGRSRLLSMVDATDDEISPLAEPWACAAWSDGSPVIGLAPLSERAPLADTETEEAAPVMPAGAMALAAPLATQLPTSGAFWGIGIGIAGAGPYDLNADDSKYAANFSIRGNFISRCRQCIHVEMGRDFTIRDNELYPDTTVSTGSGLTAAAVALYGCKRFTVDGLAGEPVGGARFLFVEWGVNIVNGYAMYASPSRDFTVRNITSRTGTIEISTAGSDDWTNSTDVQNIRCNLFKWRGLPPDSSFRNISASVIDVIGRHAWNEGSGGDVYMRKGYTYSAWNNVSCITDYASNISFAKMYCERIDQAGNNFLVPAAEDGAGHRGPLLTPVAEHYVLPDNEFPGGREFSAGTVLFKKDGGYFLVVAAGALIPDTGTYADKIKATVAGQNYIQSNMNQWVKGKTAKCAGTRIVIPGAGAGGADLVTTISRSEHTINGAYGVEINPPIQTATPENIIIRALYPVQYTEV
ncbi:phage tail-collar fiber domain-containing protein [Enterobacter asburiae]|uniref:phage tail-collar fiber domain-containing protein n=1 Tax=Enterobacter asburiae TaxID=61645 RepID=UPI00192AD47A|nr:phage tail protein [Enterobacter asburiae]MBL5924706.1 phage tail protein [Enterobacter asburiae]MBL5955493.1 phage tail protein [Enterobacter asburiae]